MPYSKRIFSTKACNLLAFFYFLASVNGFSQTAELKNYGVKDGIPSSEVYNSMQDSKGYMWFATDKGVCRFDGYEFRSFTTSNGLIDNTVFGCYEDFKHRIWFRSFSGKLSYFYNDSIYQLPINDSLSKLIKTSFVSSLSVDTLDNLYMGLINFKKGVIKVKLGTTISFSLIPMPAQAPYLVLIPRSEPLTGNTYQVDSLPDSIKRAPHFISVYKAIPGFSQLHFLRKLSLGLPGGNNMHDKAILLKNNQIAISYNHSFILLDTLLSWKATLKNIDNNFISNVSEDGAGGIWLCIQDEPMYFKDTSLIKSPLPSTLQKNNITSVTEDKEGGTWVTSLNGGIYYIPSLSSKNTTASNKTFPPVYITGLKINNQINPLSSSYNLNYNENYLIISFIGLTYKDAGKVQYRYKMEGIDTSWIYTKNRDVQYPKLSPGNYVFQVSAMNNDGIWNQKPATIQFIITPPFWATWWARTFFILVIASFIYWRFNVVTTHTKQNADVNKQLLTMELKELKAQMDPHFLFNNLNTLTQLVEIKSDDAPEFVEELSKYYRYSLQFRNTEFTSLDNEIKQAERYLHILKIRFGNNIKVIWNITETLRNHYIATYSMQLLLENITKHNIVSASKPIWVEINTNESGYLIVKNQLQLKNSTALSNKHGLKSIDQRYQLLTSKKIIVSHTSQYFSVELPLITPVEYESTYS
ncbi:MAG TPA: histidine kinase [Bacteroidia bacterium]|nr:histidine kinase [Bacteroidia bacterium]